MCFCCTATFCELKPCHRPSCLRQRVIGTSDRSARMTTLRFQEQANSTLYVWVRLCAVIQSLLCTLPLELTYFLVHTPRTYSFPCTQPWRSWRREEAGFPEPRRTAPSPPLDRRSSSGSPGGAWPAADRTSCSWREVYISHILLVISIWSCP